MRDKWQFKMASAILAVVVFSIVFWLNTGCSSVKRNNSPSVIIFVLFDISGSTAKPEIRKRYFEDFQKILEELRGGEILLGDVVTENTLATASYPIKESFPVYNPFMDNPMTY